MTDTQTWLMLVNSVSGENKTARMRIWRALKASGAAALRDGVYVLPKSDAARAVFAEQAAEAIETGGTSHILSFECEDDPQQSAMIELFDRDAEYAALLSNLDSFKHGIAKLGEGDARRQLAALRRG